MLLERSVTRGAAILISHQYNMTAPQRNAILEEFATTTGSAFAT